MAEVESKRDWASSQLGQYLADGGVTYLYTGRDDGGNFIKQNIEECDFLKKNCGVYFSAHWCGPCRNFTPKLAEKYESTLKNEGLTIIFNSWDRDEVSFNNYYKEQPWAAIPFEFKEALSKSKSFKSPGGIPALYLFDEEGALYQTSGRAAVMDGRSFPYGNPTWDEMLDCVIDQDGNPVAKADLKKNKHIALYFSGHWCGPCRGFTPKLADTYKKMVANAGDSKDFEFIFVSSDRDVPSFKEYFASMPWLAFDKEHEKYDMFKSTLSDMFGVRGIPAVGVCTVEGDIIQKNARGAASSDPNGENFPWPPKCLYKFSEGVLEGINDNPSVVLLIEKAGLTAEQRDETIALVRPHATQQLALRDKRKYYHFASCEETDVITQVRKFTKLEENCMIVLDFSEKSFYKGALPKTEEDVNAFIASIESGDCTKEALNL